MSERFSLRNLLAIKNYKDGGVFLSFTLLRFVATCLITNTHYNDVYPIRALAVGGLLGDVLFFMVSGFVLCRPTKQGFMQWYWKRLVRIYPAIFFGVVIYLITGYYTVDGHTWFDAFIFPTFFVFTAAIILLYIPLYFVNKIQEKKTYLAVIIGTIVLWLIVYIFLLDKSTYQMNNTGNPMIAFPYFLAMLFGGYIRKFGLQIKGRIKILLCWLGMMVFCCIYFVMNYLIRGRESLYPVQILVPITLLIAVVLLVCSFYSLENSFWKWPKWLLSVINFVAALTLEIYVVQKPIIQALAGIQFPINWVLITASIIAAAVVLRIVINIIITCIEIGVEKAGHHLKHG